MGADSRTRIGRERVMLMGTDRVFYLGLLGAPSLRNFGSLTVYASLQRPLRIALPGGDWVERDMAVVPPFQPHRIATDDQMIGAIMIEPESIDLGRLPAALQPTDGGPDAAMLERIRAAYAYLQRIGMSASVEGGTTVSGITPIPVYRGS